MTNMRHGKARGRKRPSGREELRKAVFGLADAMEQSLRQASHIVFVLTLLDTRHDDISEPIAVVAGEARDKLHETKTSLLKLSGCWSNSDSFGRLRVNRSFRLVEYVPYLCHPPPKRESACRAECPARAKCCWMEGTRDGDEGRGGCGIVKTNAPRIARPQTLVSRCAAPPGDGARDAKC
ncbi:MAG TPA: hypothetical protein VHU87_11850 [Rhizomicrobium sp.]|jgi:hypothetical protein|nr:hypothetical protein [Rhizomicrobium sp.]